MPGKLSVNAYDIAWANVSLLVLMFCPACKTDDPAEDTTSAPDDGTTSLSPSNMVVARLLFVERAIKSTRKTRKTLLRQGRKTRNLTTKREVGKNGPQKQKKTGRITPNSATKTASIRHPETRYNAGGTEPALPTADR